MRFTILSTLVAISLFVVSCSPVSHATSTGAPSPAPCSPSPEPSVTTLDSGLPIETQGVSEVPKDPKISEKRKEENDDECSICL
jgi:hypothetical protein